MRVVVAGGTGVVGRHVVSELEAAGHAPVVLARSRGVDLTGPEGAQAALDAVRGADAVVDVTSVTTLRRATAVRFFETVTSRLLDAGRQVGLRHLVVLSIVGVDRVPFGYYQAKLRQEELVHRAAVPATILRATQFHEFAGQVLDRSRGPVAMLPKQLNQPVAASEVAGALVELAVGPAAGPGELAGHGGPTDLVEMAGPAQERLVDMARLVEQARGGRRRVVGLQLPGETGRAMVGGGLLPLGEHRTGTQTFTEWLDTGHHRG